MKSNHTRTKLGWPTKLAAVIVCAIGGHVTDALGDWVQEAKLLPDSPSGNYFGRSVSISGDTAIIGAYGELAAYVFRWDGAEWVREAKLIPDDGGGGNEFTGGSVAISGDVVVIGTSYADVGGYDHAGSAYVFRYDGADWVQEAKILPAPTGWHDNFGVSVSISGDIIVIGAWQDDLDFPPWTSDVGSAYVFRHNGTDWVQEAKFWDPTYTYHNRFGRSVSISGDTFMVGVNDSTSTYPGAVYVFRHNDSVWVQEAKLKISDGAAHDTFGDSVSFSGDTAIMGNSNVSSRAAYVFRRDGADGVWVEEAKLLPDSQSFWSYYGHSVSIFGDTAVVGGCSEDDNGFYNAVYMFRYDGSDWVEESKLRASDGEAGDFFGHSVSIFGDTVVVGAPNSGPERAGSAYVFGLSNGLPGDLNGDGCVDQADLGILLAAYELNDGGDCDGDGDTDQADLGILLANYGSGCP